MNEPPGADVEIRHLRCLVALVRAGSLTQAAAELGITQPAVSRTLAQLERRVGVRLIDRTTRSVAPTEAGTAFVTSAEAILAAVDDAVAAARGLIGPLRLGYSWSAAGRFTAPLLRAWRARYPHRPLELCRYDDRSAGLAGGQVDLALVRVRLDPDRYAVTELYREPRCAALADTDPLASRSRLRLADLAGRPLATVSAYGTTTLTLWPDDRRPWIAVDARNIDDWLSVIISGQAVGVTPASTADQYPRPGLAYLPLIDAPPVVTYVARDARRPDPWHRRFLALARDVVDGATVD